MGIEELFLYQSPQFENVLDLNLRDVPLRVIVKAQDYQLDECKEDDYYLGNFHKEGLYEDIAAVGLYYYHIDDGIKGGELQLSSLIETKSDGGSHYRYRFFEKEWIGAASYPSACLRGNVCGVLQ